VRSRRRDVAGAWVLAAVALCAPSVRGQDEPAAEVSPEEAVEAYMERLGLRRLQAEQLAGRLEAATREGKVSELREPRAALAERLGKIYVELLTSASTAEERSMWETRARELLQAVPEADTQELRINLAKAVYARAEEVAERGRLLLASEDELAEAQRGLRSVHGQLSELARRLHGRVELLEKQEEGGDQSPQLQQELSEARRLRSLAFYFSGWSSYYLAMLTGSDAPATEALRSFGWLLGVPGNRPASLEKLPTNLLRFEHVSRAAIGAALASGLKGNDVEAIQWLNAVEAGEEVPKAVRDQILARRIIVLAGSKRWADLEQAVRRARKSDRTGGGPNVEPLSASTARLLAVLTLEADKKIAGPQIESLARVALADLIARQQVSQVLDLVQRFGTAPIGDSGFIVDFVRGAMAYDQARAAHRAAGGDVEEPAKEPTIVNQYRAAGELLEAALAQPDASEFPSERVRTAMMSGRARFFAGDFAPAADRFTGAFELLSGAGKAPEAGGATAGELPPEAEEALWLAVVSLDRAARAATGASDGGAKALTLRRDQAAGVFMQTFPESERVPRIVLMQAEAGGLGEEESLKVLAAVPESSPVYAAARRQVVRIWYQRFRTGGAGERDLAAAQFLRAVPDVLAIERAAAVEPGTPEAKAAAERVLVRCRQILDASLGTSTPDPDRAESALALLEGVAAQHGLDVSGLGPELGLRRVQIALARGKLDAAVAAADQLAGLAQGGGQFGAAAERLVYRRVAADHGASPTPASAATLVRLGVRILQRTGTAPKTLADPALLTLAGGVARAADELAAAGDTSQRDTAITLDKAILAAQPRVEASLRRLARNAEAAGDGKQALECWRTLLGAAQVGTEAWFEARFESLRLLAGLDEARAREAMQQHRVLFPTFGTEPWGGKLRELAGKLGVPTDVPPAGAGGGR
jgi:hypothetical protein